MLFYGTISCRGEQSFINLNTGSFFSYSYLFYFRVGLLASLCRDSSSVRIYDILHYTHGGEDQEPAVITRSINPDSSTYISAFSWHPTHENRIITASYTGLVSLYSLFSPCLSFSLFMCRHHAV